MDSNNNIITLSSNANDFMISNLIADVSPIEHAEKSAFPEIPKLKLSKPATPNKRYYTLLKEKRESNLRKQTQNESAVIMASPEQKKSPNSQNTRAKNRSLSISSIQKEDIVAHDMTESEILNQQTFNAQNKEPKPPGKENKINMIASYKSSPKKPSFTYPKVTEIHYNKLKQRVGMNTHIAHPRPYRDIPCSSKDIDLAIDATRIIELNRERVKRMAANYYPKKDEKGMSSKEMESFILNFDNDKFLINNPIFSTLWERIFVQKDMILTSGKQNYLAHQEKDQERLLSKYAFKNGLPYFKGDIEQQEKLRSSTINANETSLVKFLDKTQIKSLEIDRNDQKKMTGASLLYAKPNRTNYTTGGKKLFDSNKKGFENTQAETAMFFTKKNKDENENLNKSAFLFDTNSSFNGVKTIDETKYQFESFAKRTMVKKINYLTEQREKAVKRGNVENPLEMLSQTYDPNFK